MKKIRENYVKIPWRAISGMKDVLIHGYMGVNLQDVWKTAKYDIIDLEKQINKILSEL